MTLQAAIPLALKASVLLNVFAIGLQANARDTIHLFRRPAELGRAFLAVNVVMPLFALGVIYTVDLSPAVKIAIVMLSVSPIPPLLPKKMVKAGGGVSYVTGLLIAVCLLAIVFVPVAIELIGRVVNLPLHVTVGSIARLILLTALLPLFAGIAVRSLVPALAARVAGPLAKISSVVLVVCVAAILWVAAHAVLAVTTYLAVATFVAFVLLGLAAGTLLGGPDRDNRSALAIAASSRHPGIAIAIAQANFPGQKGAIAAVLLYLIVNGVLSVPFALWTRRRDRAR